MRSSDTNSDALIEKIYRENGQLAMRAAYRILGDRHLAEDAFQLALISIAQNPEKLPEPPDERVAYTVRTAVNAAIDIYRKYDRIWDNEIPIRDNETSGEDEAVNSGGYFREWRTESFEDEVLEKIEIEKLFTELNEMGKDDGTIIKEHIFYGLTMKEIAERHDISEDTAWKRYYRSMGKLKEKLKDKA